MPTVLKQDFAELSAILQKSSGELQQPSPREAAPRAELAAGPAARGATGQLAGAAGTAASPLEARRAPLTLGVAAGAVLLRLQKHFSQPTLATVGFLFYFFFSLASCPHT